MHIHGYYINVVAYGVLKIYSYVAVLPYWQDQIKYFNLTITPCPPGHVLLTVDASDEYECRCNVENDQNIIGCLEDERKLVLKVRLLLYNYSTCYHVVQCVL